MKIIIIISVLLGLGLMLPIPKKVYLLQEALEKQAITAKVKGLGGYQGYCIELTATNQTDIDTTFYIEPGRRLISQDTTIQDILLVKEIPIFVKAHQTVTVPLYGFCCQATNGGPKKDEVFSIGHTKDTVLVKLAHYLNTHPFDEDIIQSAVWIASNGHSLSSISAKTPDKRKEIKQLQNFLAGLLHLKNNETWYSLSYKIDTNQLFSGVADSLFGDIEYETWNNSPITMVINDSKGAIIKRIMKNKPHNPGKYSYELNLNVSNWKKGIYYVRIFVENQRKKEFQFEL